MKKNYSKPEIVFESFKLSTSIAGTCATKEDPYEGAGGFIIFVTPSVCDFTPQEDESSGICYQVPNEDIRMFAS